MNIQNNKKTNQLGIPFGTAMHRLRKIIMFKLIQKCNEDICYRCNKKIENVEDLSIEHKVPWLYGDIKLFWDLNNIAFSHLSCNTLSKRTNKINTFINGKKRCKYCKKYKKINCFPQSELKVHSGRCTICNTKQKRKWRMKNSLYSLNG